MGLDNGFIVRHKTTTAQFVKNLPSFVKLPWEYKENSEYVEIAYWRKCWGLRNEINSVLHLGDKYECNVDKEDIPAILKAIQRYLNPDYWNENADSIWEWEEYFPHMVQQYMNLTYLYEMWDNYPGLEVVWYDSY